MPRLLDLYCGRGGAAMGYYRAGFTEIVGIDIEPQPRYPFDFIQANALDTPLDLASFDLIHASPICKRFSALNARFSLDASRHPDLIGATRALLQASHKPFVIENVPGAPLFNPLLLCGSMFGLALPGRGYLRRHRLFESNILILAPSKCDHKHKGRALGVYGHGAKDGKIGGIALEAEAARRIMEMPWSDRDGLSQAIPPAYTEWLGRQILAVL